MSNAPVAVEVRQYRTPEGLTLVADVGGDPAAPPVILLHGGGQTRHSWHGVMQRLLAAGYHVINCDARGHGDSGWSEIGRYDLAAMADDLGAIIATLPTAPALVGASMGGATALYANGHGKPAMTRALVLVDIVPKVESEGGGKILAFMRANPEGFATLDDAAAAVAAYNPHRPRPKDNSGLMKNLRLRSDGRLYWHWDPKVIEHDSRAEPPSFKDRLYTAAAMVRVPVLLVRGLKSDIVTDEGIAEFREHLPALEVVDVAGAGHMVAGDRNDAFNEGVISFLAKHLPIGG